ncbi:hypothetical protein Moror_7647 [Moniliophthora roreri MCA 2997]|uniref:Retrotransposon gag domain-containing protein n=1 Tax=Moniliophthora roreri (strain MCA 2997) TaxID=1381753 RepID=V2XCS4_MONRO|nr:hypothetical protein Moror_7647 [Moniliophthora roreri MCA 2997]
MNPLRANTDEKKKMILLSLLKGKKTAEWKMMEQMRLFPEDDNPKEKRKAAKETWSSFKQRFWTEWQPVDLKGQVQMKIKEIRMTDRADDYINKFHLIAMETKYDKQALMKFFREGLPISLQDKIMLRTDGAPETLDKWYQTAIRYDNQYKLVMANKKRRRPKEPVKPKVLWKEKEVVISGILSESEQERLYGSREVLPLCKDQSSLMRLSYKGTNDHTDSHLNGTKETLSMRGIHEDQSIGSQTRRNRTKRNLQFHGERGFLRRQERPMLLLPLITISNVVLAKLNRNFMHIPIQYNVGTEIVEQKALIDSGARGHFISEEEAK